MSIENIFLDQTFKLYKLNRLLSTTDTVFNAEQEAFLRRNLSRRIYDSYVRSESLIEFYESVEAVDDDLRIYTGTQHTDNGHTIQWVTVRCLDLIPRQMFVFIDKNTEKEDMGILVLSSGTKHAINAYIRSLMENMDEEPLIVRDYVMRAGYINHVLNIIFTHLVQEEDKRVVETLVGDIEIVYTIKGNIINQNLRTISVSIPSRDAQKLLDEKGALVQLIHEYIQGTTTVSLDNLTISKFISNLISISADAKVRLSKAILTMTTKDKLVWLFLEQL